MDFLNKAYAQFSDLYRSMTPGARITSVLLLAVVVASLGYLFVERSSGPGMYLMNGEPFPAGAIRDMEAAFAQAGLNSYEIEGTRIRVPRGQQTAYMAALADANALPRNFGQVMENALDNGNVFEDREKRRERLKIAKQQELSQIISLMDGIDAAMIFWDTEEKAAWGRERTTTASVNVRPKGTQELDGNKVSSIRHTVAAAVAGLKPENVTVVDLSTGRSFRGDASGMGSASDDPYAERKRWYEDNWKAEILAALSYVPGVSVAVNVALDPKRSHRQREVKNDPKTVAVQVTDKTRSTVQDGADPAGRPGYQANQPMALSSSTTKGSHQEEEESEQTTVNALSGSTVELENQGLIPQRVAVSIGIPTSYFEKVWRERNPPDPNAQAGAPPKTPTQAELDPIRQQRIADIQKHVAGLLPPAEGIADPTQLVTVTEFQDITMPEVPQPAMSEKAIAWLGQSWTTLGMILLALVSLAMLRSMVRSAPLPAPVRTTLLSARAEEPEEKEEEGATAAERRLRRFQSGTSLKDELSLLVAEDPDAAANILRTWIGHPG
ncbi:MAG: hypothetical protein HUU20_08080 [Pirellulales bacterium]|nr:hypothetical protein [Pirellulales bacterium]